MLANLTDPVVIVPILTVIAGIVLNSWFSLRKLATREKFQTSRFTEALKGTSPQERPEIIRALSALEDGGDNGVTSGAVADGVDPAELENRAILGGLQRLWRNTTSAKGH